MAIHVAITRRVRAGREAEFEAAVREFFRGTLHGGVLGVHMLAPAPGAVDREYGIVRSFVSEEERDAFYRSPAFAEWETRVEPLTEGATVRRELTGLEAWFRGAPAPQRWKMAVATLIGVYPTSLALGLTLGVALDAWPLAIRSLAIAAAMVAALTWLVMPAVTRLLGPWLRTPPAGGRP